MRYLWHLAYSFYLIHVYDDEDDGMVVVVVKITENNNFEGRV